MDPIHWFLFGGYAVPAGVSFLASLAKQRRDGEDWFTSVIVAAMVGATWPVVFIPSETGRAR